jgi:NAD(P)-dependent dehydrogenase (short-subunit alcohol dehydrogenase family)
MALKKSGGKLVGKSALVTGAGGGIGGAIARAFAAEGAAVTAADIDPAAAEATVAAIKATGGRAAACPLDVSKADQCERAVQYAIEHFGGPHVLANVAASMKRDGSVVDLAFEDWMQEMTVNLGGVFLMCKYAIPRMIEAGGGAIVNIASTYGHIGMPERAAYCTSKAGIINLTRVMAIDYGRDGIRVNSISPGAIDTPKTSGAAKYGSPENARRVRGAQYLVGRIGRPEEIAAGAVFLCSDDGAFCTGTDFRIDGGFLAVKYPPGQSPAEA